MPAKRVEIIGTERPLGGAAQIKLKKLDTKGIGHAKCGCDLGCGMALACAGHAVIDLGQQHNIGGQWRKVTSGLLREQAAFDIPCSDADGCGQLGGPCLPAQLHRLHSWQISQ